jgi:hypothetical protein
MITTAKATAKAKKQPDRRSGRRSTMVRNYPSIRDGSSFTLANLTQLAAIPLVTGVITVVGWYYVTNDRLNRYGDDIKTLNTKVEQSTNVVSRKASEDLEARSKIRDDFLTQQVKTNEGIAKLDSRLAVAEAQQSIMNQQLSKIADSLSRLTTFALPSPSRK